ncbi:MAG: tRNA (guanosine(37)-N1)-methyltransferase TrmD [Candidatus Paceibacterota bacterium]
MLTFHIITLFPEAIEPYIKTSILGRALEKKKIKVLFYDPKDHLEDPKERVDGKPFGGGPGMVIRSEPVIKAILKAKGRKKNCKIIFFDRKGKRLTNERARSFAEEYKHIILVSGRYEGIDARVYEVFKKEGAERLSIGPFILTGGEIPALAVLDCVSRQVPGVLGDRDSLEENRYAGKMVYTRPAKIVHRGKNYTVPKVLRSGDHAKIEKWRKKRS